MKDAVFRWFVNCNVCCTTSIWDSTSIDGAYYINTRESLFPVHCQHWWRPIENGPYLSIKFVCLEHHHICYAGGNAVQEQIIVCDIVFDRARIPSQPHRHTNLLCYCGSNGDQGLLQWFSCQGAVYISDEISVGRTWASSILIHIGREMLDI